MCKYRLCHVGVFSAMLIAVSLTSATPTLAQNMTAHFIAMGQADAALLEFPCGAMLIDAGAQDKDQVPELVAYLNDFFDRRPDLNDTLDVILITHNHIDHTLALREVVEAFTVENYIGSGHDSGKGTGDPNWVRANADSRGITVLRLLDQLVEDSGSSNGLTNDTIDPIDCSPIDPEIHILSGALEDNPDWSDSEFKNKNNHSLVVRIDYGTSSFLFTGDLEESAIERLLDRYETTGVLDVDIYQVGHHGSHNGTTLDLLDVMTPEIAIISVGEWNFGKKPRKPFSTYAYGHSPKTFPSN